MAPPRAARGRRHVDRVLGFWSILSLTSPPFLLCFQGPKGELEFQFPPTMVMTEVRLSRRTVWILIGACAVSISSQRCHILTRYPHFHFSALQEEGAIRLAKADESKKAREGHGLYRTLCNNMMVGVSTGFEKKLKLVGVGYKAAMQGKDLNLALGYAHPVILEVPEGLKVECPSNTEVVVSGYDKVEVGNFAAIIRSKRKPEPYKGKGVRYHDEVVLIKEGKRK